MQSDDILSIVYQNVRGLNSKLSSLFLQSFGFNFDVIVFTETWLRENIHNSEILCLNYQIFRCDRLNKTGGGVLIAVCTKLPSEQISLQLEKSVEFIAVKICIKNKSLFISCSYIPPGSNADLYALHVSAIKSAFFSAKASDLLMVLGDFNLPTISWNKSSSICNSLTPVFMNGCSNEFIESLLNFGLLQINNIQNSSGRTLDLVLVDQPSDISIKPTNAISLPEDRYHPTLYLQVLKPATKKITPLCPKIFCFSRTDYSKLKGLLSNVKWNDILNCNELDDMVDVFYSTLLECISQSVPKVFNRKSNGPPWNNDYLARAKNKKNKLFKKYKKSGSGMDYSNYSLARSEYNIVNKRAYDCYIIRMRNKLKQDPKSFYTFVNSKRRSNEYPQLMKLGNIESFDELPISNLFADFFEQTYSVNHCSSSYPNNASHSSIITIPELSFNTVLSNLKRLKTSYTPGPDGIPANILKFCANSLCYPLLKLFNKSLSSGYFPKLWKQSYIIPLFKSGSKSEVRNYRGIAKLSSIPKLLEKMLTDNLSHHVSCLLSSCQHGFRKSRSTITNILQLTTTVNEGFVRGLQTDVIYTDFSKAFDKVNHNLLLTKLSHMGFTDSFLKWLRSYLTNRTQQVKFRNVLSRNILVTSGVPQGSHLGPVLFTLFINDLPTIINNAMVLMYADDVKLSLTLNNLSDEQLLQSDIDSLFRWCNVNFMELNIKKCKQMSFYRSNQIYTSYYIDDNRLDLADSFMDLGILLDKKLNFRSHLSLTVNKSNGVLGFIKRWCKEFSDPYVTKQLFISLVRPILEYGCVIWDPYYTIHINLIESVQKQFLIFCLRGLGWNSYRLPSYEARLGLIKLPSLKSRRTMLCVSFMMGLINGNTDAEYLLNKLFLNVPVRPTRNFQFFYTNFHRSNYANNDPFRRLCVTFNKLYHLIELCESNDVLKRKIILYLNN